METTLEFFIISQLQSRNILYKVLTNDIYVMCPFHVHSNRKYHLSIRKDGKKVHCWACDWGKGKTWNDYAEAMGLTSIDEDLVAATAFDSLYAELQTLKEEELSIEDRKQLLCLEELDSPWFRHGKGEDIKYSLLKKLGVQKYYDENGSVNRLFLPSYVGKKLHGWFLIWNDSERLPKDWEMKSINSVGKWVHNILYPINYIVKKAKEDNDFSVFLVEGQYDALHLIQEGYNALSVCGVSTWSKNKYKLLDLFDLSPVYILFDADTAGLKATFDLIKAFKSYGFDDYVAVILPPFYSFVDGKNVVAKRDPGDLTKEQLTYIKGLLKKYEGEINILNIQNFESGEYEIKYRK